MKLERLLEPYVEEGLSTHAKQCYTLCVHWFGTPNDAEKRWLLFPVDRGKLYRSVFDGTYLIGYPRKLGFMAACVCIGHEMYHRVTVNVKGLRQKLWVDEMMACMTSYKVMQEAGWQEYELNVRIACSEALHSPVGVQDVEKVTSWRKGPVTWVFPNKYYPALYGNKVVALGSALLEIVGWDALALIVRASTIDNWIDRLTAEQSISAKIILDMSVPTTDVGIDIRKRESLRKLAAALRWVRRIDDSIGLLSNAVDIDPGDTASRYDLALGLYEAKRPAEAIEQALEVIRTKSEDMHAHYFVGNVLLEQGDAAGACEHLALSAKLSPVHAYSHFKLGLALQQCGEYAAANVALTRASEIGDDWIVNAARDALKRTTIQPK